MKTYTYEESVQWMRDQSQDSEFVRQCYLDQDNVAAAIRFSESEEFAETVNLLALNSPHKTLKILDLGCGNGIASYAFASLGHDIVSVDPDLSEDVGLQATQRLSDRLQRGSISVMQAFAESLPFQDSSFDIVYTRQALHHFSNLEQGVAECFRVLKSGGFLLATREHVISNPEQLQEFLSNHVLHQLHAGENAYPLNTYLAAIEKAGFEKIISIAPYASVINHFPVSNGEVKEELSNSLKSKLGSTLAVFLSRMPIVEKLYRWHRSNQCQTPGRLYSFFCTK
jgi:ubiquinone/menaquinone biosynthesis C-methylase UbiE